MTKESLAAELNGNEYGNEINICLGNEAAAEGLVVLYGYSDDNVELKGAVDDEVGAYNGTTLYLDAKGLLKNECEDDYCPYFERAKESAKTVTAVWHDNGEYAWTFTTDIPHATFDIMEDGDKFCRGIVIDLKEVA